MRTTMKQSPLSAEAAQPNRIHPFRLDLAMSHVILICCFAALLGAGSTHSANAIESASQTAWAQARLACADVGIAPGSGAFGQCVFDLYYSLWDEQNEFER
jgi:hypothetical protein